MFDSKQFSKMKVLEELLEDKRHNYKLGMEFEEEDQDEVEVVEKLDN